MHPYAAYYQFVARYGKFSEKDHPRADDGKFTDGSGSVSKADFEFWEDYATGNMIKAASRGETLHVGSTNIGGFEQTEADVKEATALADKLQKAATSNHTKHKLLWRGEVFESEAEVFERYPIGQVVKLSGLTATSHDRDVAKIYTSGEFIGMPAEEGVKVLLRFGTNNKHGLMGLDKSGNDMLPETILPHGYEFKASRATKQPDGSIIIDMYRPQKTPGKSLGMK